MESTFGVYVHSDSVTQNKGAALALVSGEAFARQAARFAYATSAQTWDDVVSAMPDAEEARTSHGAEVKAISVTSLASAEVGRVEVAMGDNKAAIVKVLCATDFGAKTVPFKNFTASVAGAAARLASSHWGTLTALEPRLESQRKQVSEELREPVDVAAVSVITF